MTATRTSVATTGEATPLDANPSPAPLDTDRALDAVRRYNAALDAGGATAADLRAIADALDAAAATAYDLTPGQRMQLRDRADDARGRADLAVSL